MLVRKAAVIPIECVARGYLAGSGWKEYQKSKTVCGVELPDGLKQCDKLPRPIFTPATKEEHGHDINISFEDAAGRIGANLAAELRERTLSLYSRAAEYAAGRGILIADTKFEFGQLPDGKLILIDEVLTPDSSRFWPAGAAYAPGEGISRALTSNSCVIGWSSKPGTRRRPRRSCRWKWSRERGGDIWRRLRSSRDCDGWIRRGEPCVRPASIAQETAGEHKVRPLQVQTLWRLSCIARPANRTVGH